MAKKTDILSITGASGNHVPINANFEALNNKLENTLSLDGSIPNAMNADLDMNGNDIINAGSVNLQGGQTLESYVDDAAASATASATAAAQSAIDATTNGAVQVALAATQANNAAASATNAANSANTSGTKAAEAEASALAATVSENNAANSATLSSTKADEALQSANNASDSETNINTGLASKANKTGDTFTGQINGTTLTLKNNKDLGTDTSPDTDDFGFQVVSGTAVVGVGQKQGDAVIQAFGTGTAYNLHLNPNAGTVFTGGDLTTGGNVTVSGNIVLSGTVDGRNVSTDGAKLDTIEGGATADQTGSEIVASIDAELGNTVWKTGGSGSTDLNNTALTGTTTLQNFNVGDFFYAEDAREAVGIGADPSDRLDHWANDQLHFREGYLGTNGSFALSLYANGYRNNTDGFTYLNRGGNTDTASGIDLMPNGSIQFRGGTAASIAPPLLGQWNANGELIGTANRAVVVQCNNISDLKNKSVLLLPLHSIASVRSFSTFGDGGGGLFQLKSGTLTTSLDGIQFNSNSAGYYWERVGLFNGPVPCIWAGVFPNNSSSNTFNPDGFAANNRGRLNALISWCASNTGSLYNTTSINTVKQSILMGAGYYDFIQRVELLEGVSLFGTGQASTTLRTNDTSGGLVRLLCDTTFGWGSTIQNLSIIHFDKDNAGTCKGFECVRLVRSLCVRDVTILGFHRNIVHSNVWEFEYINVFSGFASDRCFYADGLMNSGIFIGCRLDDSKGLYVVELNASDDFAHGIKFLSCAIQRGFRRGIGLAGVRTFQLDNCQFEGNNRDTSLGTNRTEPDIWVEGPNKVSARITGNYFTATGRNGATLSRAINIRSDVPAGSVFTIENNSKSGAFQSMIDCDPNVGINIHYENKNVDFAPVSIPGNVNTY